MKWNKNESEEINFIVQKTHKTKSESAYGDYWDCFKMFSTRENETIPPKIFIFCNPCLKQFYEGLTF